MRSGTKKHVLPSREAIRAYLASFDLFQKLDRTGEGQEYLTFHLGRFIKSIELLPALEEGTQVLELGAAPYFMTLLMKKYLGFSVTTANFFGDYGDPPSSALWEEHIASAEYDEVTPSPTGCSTSSGIPFRMTTAHSVWSCAAKYWSIWRWTRAIP